MKATLCLVSSENWKDLGWNDRGLLGHRTAQYALEIQLCWPLGSEVGETGKVCWGQIMHTFRLLSVFITGIKLHEDKNLSCPLLTELCLTCRIDSVSICPMNKK